MRTILFSILLVGAAHAQVLPSGTGDADCKCECVMTNFTPAPTPVATATPTAIPTATATATATATMTATATPADTTPPFVKILSPLSGATVPAGALQVTVDATDNIGIAGVRFFLNGGLMGTKNTPPWVATFQNVQPPAATINADAFDRAGNTSRAEVNIKVSLNPNPTPTP